MLDSLLLHAYDIYMKYWQDTDSRLALRNNHIYRLDRYFLACANRSKSGPAFSKSASVIAGVIYTSAFKSSHNGSNSPGILSSLGTFNTKYIVRCPCESVRNTFSGFT